MLKFLSRLIALALLVGVGLMAFSGAAFAQAAATSATDTTSWMDILQTALRPVYDAFSGGHYAYAAALLVIALVALAKRYLAPKYPVLTTNAGGAAMALTAATATAMATALAVPDATVSLDLLKSSLLVGVGAAGGYAMIKSLVIDPLIKPLAAKAPLWMQPLFSLVLWIFDKSETSANAAEDATKAGDAAVAAKPGTGLIIVVGKPTEIK